MKSICTLLLLLCFSHSFSQWTRVKQLPASNIFTLFHVGNTLYAGGTNLIYVSKNKGQKWDSTTAIPGLSSVSSIIDNIIIYKSELYASAHGKGVFKSIDGGKNWRSINAGIPKRVNVTDLCKFKGNLYAATEGSFGDPVYKLDSIGRISWVSFNKGLSGISSNMTSIIGTSNTLIAGANINGLYDYLPPKSTTWEERFFTNPPITGEGVADIVTGHDTLFLAGKTGLFYTSTDKGLTWNFFGNRLVTGATFLANAKQAIISSRYIFNGSSNTTLFYYIKKDSLQTPFVNFSTVTNHFTWKIDILGDKLWDASDHGLFFMPLSDLPGITAADDSDPIILPVHFESVNAVCEASKVVVKWKIVQQPNSSYYTIERSVDGINWTIIGENSAVQNNSTNSGYSFTDYKPVQNGLYRIAEHDADDTIQYSNVVYSSCITTDVFSTFPNPVHDNLFINITANSKSTALIEIFDKNAVLVKLQNTSVLQGSNHINIDMKSLANGIYHLLVKYNNGQTQKTIQILKQ